jgi:hypothetical protein
MLHKKIIEIYSENDKKSTKIRFYSTSCMQLTGTLNTTNPTTKPKVLVEWLTVLLFIREVTG